VPTLSSLRRFAWFVLVYAVLTVLWGAVVRATGSGAGCGAHWPLCNGEFIPPSPAWTTRIEFFHRLMSGLMLIFSVVLFLWGRRLPRAHPGRMATTWVLIFTLSEAAVGALLVLERWVALDASAARAVGVAAHLLNTFLLLGALAASTDAVVQWAAPRPAASAPLADLSQSPREGLLFGVVTVLLLAVGVSGAIAALGDTLFPAKSLSEGWAQDLSPTAHFLLRLRALHPLLALVSGLIAAGVGFRASFSPSLSSMGFAVVGIVALQLAVGLANWFLLAPLALQLIHLLLADLLWIVWVKLVFRRSLLLRQSP
jgi:heme A synthase